MSCNNASVEECLADVLFRHMAAHARHRVRCFTRLWSSRFKVSLPVVVQLTIAHFHLLAALCEQGAPDSNAVSTLKLLMKNNRVPDLIKHGVVKHTRRRRVGLSVSANQRRNDGHHELMSSR